VAVVVKSQETRSKRQLSETLERPAGERGGG
jgi:hypothetical protein